MNTHYNLTPGDFEYLPEFTSHNAKHYRLNNPIHWRGILRELFIENIRLGVTLGEIIDGDLFEIYYNIPDTDGYFGKTFDFCSDDMYLTRCPNIDLRLNNKRYQEDRRIKGLPEVRKMTEYLEKKYNL